MSYKLLVEKIGLRGGIMTREEIRGYCKTLEIPYSSAIAYLLANRYLVRILRGIFCVIGLEDRKRKVLPIDFNEAISRALEIKKIGKWYFGLESAVKLNNISHEYFGIDYILTDRLKRPRPINILGRKVRFIAIKPALFEFGIIHGAVPYSDVEKTVLDIVYLGKYSSNSPAEIKYKIEGYLSLCSKSKILRYSKHYPASVSNLLKEMDHDIKTIN